MFAYNQAPPPPMPDVPPLPMAPPLPPSEPTVSVPQPEVSIPCAPVPPPPIPPAFESMGPPAVPAPAPPLPPPPATTNGVSVSSILPQNWMDPRIIGQIDQTGPLLLGPGAKRDASGSICGPLPKISKDQSSTVQKAKKYAMEQSIKMVLMKQTLAHQQQQAKTMARHQAIILMCRIYVGSINFEVREDTLRTAFLPFGPIRSISMSWDPQMQKHKGFAFVEYEIPEAAQLALEQMNGVIICGRNIKVGRSSNMPQAQAVIDEIQEQSKSYNRIYIASIHPDLTQDDIKSVFEAFGPITSCELAMSSIPGKHKGYCFIEYATLQSCQDAISAMNLFDLGGNYLRVGRSITPPDTKNTGPPVFAMQSMPTAAAVAAAAATAKIQALDAVASNLGLSSDVLTSKDSKTAAAIVASTAAPTMSKMGPPMVANIPPPGVVQFQAPTVMSSAPAPAAAVPPPQVIVPPPPVSQTPVTTVITSLPAAVPPPATMTPAETLAKLTAEAQQKQQEDLQKKLMDGPEIATLSQQENLSIKGQSARHLVMQKLMRGTKTESVVVLLRNMVTPEEVDEELQEEVQEECSKFGEVERVIIYHEQQSEDDPSDIVVKIFVEFKDAKSAKSCKETLHGRYFAGKVISAQIYDQELYDHNDFSG